MGRAPLDIDVQNESFTGGPPIAHPAGHLDSSNQRGDMVVAFWVDRLTGALEVTGRHAAVGDPSCIILLGLNNVG